MQITHIYKTLNDWPEITDGEPCLQFEISKFSSIENEVNKLKI